MKDKVQMRRESGREIEAAAARWAARVDRGLSPVEQKALEAWLAADDRRRGAYAMARGVALRSERARALGPQYEPARFLSRPTVSRRAMLGAGGAVAAGICAAVLIGDRIGSHYATRRGEMKVVPLDDGSVVTLNTDSELSVSYSKRRRFLQLIRGEALFDVAKDAARPFVVSAGDMEVRAVGTSFTVRRIPDTPIQVLVREGVVEMHRTQSHSRETMRLQADTKAIAVPAQQSIQRVSLARSETQRELMWKDARIAFEGQTLEEAVAEYARYSDTRIVIDDPSLRSAEITGLFDTHDPVGFAQAVARVFNAKAEVSNGQVRLTR